MKFSFDFIMKELEYILEKIVIKRSFEANKYETKEIKRSYDRYYSARNHISNYYTYTKFDRQVYMDLGIPSYKIKAMTKKDLKEMGLIDKAIELQDKITIANFEERNNYYRRIMGKPDIDDTQFIYAPIEFYAEYEIDIKPVHLFTLKEYNRLQKSKYFKETITDNIDKSYTINDGETEISREYLKYLGDNKIDVINAREAKNFEILYINTDGINEYLFEEFVNIYNKVRDYYMLSIYNNKFTDIYTEYDTFLGVLIMYRTLETLIVNTLRFNVERNYFDLRTMRLVYDAYDVPFDENISLEYHRYMLRNLNYLLHNKASDKCLREVFNIFGRGDMKLYRYYLIKRHKLDEDGNPIFLYKEDLKGNKLLDAENMYDLYFQAVDSRLTNITSALRENYIQEPYDSVIVNDPYWVDDDLTRDTLFGIDFNYIETKYLGVMIMRQMTKLMFEMQYSIRMVIDDKSEMEKITVSVSTLKEDITLFECVITLCALIAKKFNFAGNIISDPTQVYNIYGFNVKADVQEIIDSILNSEYADPAIKDILIDLKIDDKEDVDTLYKNIMTFRDIILNRRFLCDSIHEYRLYDRAYRVLMTTDETDELFTKKDGNIAKTYIEYIRDINPDLAESIDEVNTSEQIMTFADAFIEAILTVIKDIELVFEMNDAGNDIISRILKLAMFFKSYTTDLLRFTSSININDLDNRIKLLADIDNINIELTVKSFIQGSYDTLHIENDLTIKEKPLLQDKLKIM